MGVILQFYQPDLTCIDQLEICLNPLPCWGPQKQTLDHKSSLSLIMITISKIIIVQPGRLQQIKSYSFVDFFERLANVFDNVFVRKSDFLSTEICQLLWRRLLRVSGEFDEKCQNRSLRGRDLEPCSKIYSRQSH